jgi:hypothetical protein
MLGWSPAALHRASQATEAEGRLNPGYPMPEPFTIEKLMPLMDSAGVDRAVIVPPIWPGDRNDYALEAAGRYPERFGVMGRIALDDPQMAGRLPHWRRQPGMRRALG